jgi:ferredoxin-type protein NapF
MTAEMNRRQFLTGSGEGRKAGPHVEASCLAALGVHCQTCGDACPEAAIRFRPRLGLPPMPELDADLCTLCAECVKVCPADALRIPDREAADA